MRTIDRVGNRGAINSGRRGRRAGGWLLRAGVAGVAAIMVAGAAASCSLIVDTNANQCQPATFNTDCAGFPGFRSCPTTGENPNICVASSTVPTCKSNTDCGTYAGATCNTTAGVCTRPCTASADCGFENLTCSNGTCVAGSGGDGGMSCSLNADCTGLGTYYICRQQKCVSLVTDLCTTVYASKSPASAAYMDDTAVIFGSILPTAANSDGPYGHLVEDSIKLALDDFKTADGIPSLTGGSNRPLVLVGCNDGVNEDQTDVAAKHLIDDLAVPAIIGYAFSGNTISVAQDVTIPSGVLLFSPSATSAQITQLEATDKDLVWRDCPSDNVQAQALTLYYASVQAAALAKYPNIDKNNVKVAIVNHSDAYGSGLGDTLEGSLKFNGMSATAQSGTNYLRVDYGASTSPDLSKIPSIVSFAPDIIFLFGFNEGPDQIFTSVETQWKSAVPTDGHYPFWVFSDGGEVASLWASSTNPATAADITTADQRLRVSGTVPGTNATSWPPYGTFLTEFTASSYFATDGSADTIGPAGAYDALFLLAYSTVMVGKNPLTGPNLVQYGLSQMKKTQGLTQIQINRNNILNTFPQLTTGMPIDVTGVSGPLPFTGKGDITTADIQIWCVPPATAPDTDVGGAAINSGLYFNSTSNALTGCISTMCGLPADPSTCM
jgi:branched-chain amino acid transport system substrate-binding protein